MKNLEKQYEQETGKGAGIEDKYCQSYSDSYVHWLESQLEGKVMIPEELSDSDCANVKIDGESMFPSELRLVHKAIVKHFKELK